MFFPDQSSKIIIFYNMMRYKKLRLLHRNIPFPSCCHFTRNRYFLRGTLYQIPMAIEREDSGYLLGKKMD